MLRVRLLGTVQVAVEGNSVFVKAGTAKQSCVLAVLAMAPGRPVPSETLIHRVWGDEPPRTARDVLYQHASHQRALGLPVRRSAAGYVLELAHDEIDIHRSRSLAHAAREAMGAGRNDVAADSYRQASLLWQDTPLNGVGGDWAAGVRDGLNGEYLTLLGELFEVELRRGRHAEVLPELLAAFSADPLAEVLAGQVMVALSRCGRTTEALQCFAQLRQRTRDQLGIEPGAKVSELHVRIMRQDPSLLRADGADGGDQAPEAGSSRSAEHDDPGPTRAQAPPARPVGWVIPKQLPADITGFAGRTAELSVLDGLLAAGGDGLRTVCVSGTAGVGKTTLVVRWAHRVSDRFPDGQLYMNLRGFDSARVPVAPDEAVRDFLDALGLPPERIPPDLDGRCGLYRSLLAGKQMLVVLDNARDASQARPLLPGSPGCMTLVTSRNQLTGLVATDSAYPITLDVLSAGDARQLLSRRLGRERIEAQAEAVEQVINACARLPLALAVAAARAQQTGFSLAVIAAGLDKADHRLDALDVGDPTAQVRAVFSWSYQALTAAAARLFRLLGLHPGPDISTLAAAGLAGRPVTETRRMLTELTRANLLTEHRSERYTFHDLLRDYATELVQHHHSNAEREAGIRRLADYYLRSAHAADRLLFPHRDPVALPAARRGIRAEEFRERDAAMTWLSTERRALVAMVSCAATNGQHALAWRLGWAVAEFLDWQGHWLDQAETQRVSLDSARAICERIGEAHAHRHLGRASLRLNRGDLAHSHYHEAITLFAALDDPAGQAATRLSLAFLRNQAGDARSARDQSQQALRLYRIAGRPYGEAIALNALGWYNILLDRGGEGLAYCEQALALQERIGDLSGQAGTLASIGNAHERMGNYDRALHYYRKLLPAVRQGWLRDLEADTLDHIGEIHNALGDRSSAIDAWKQALAIFDDIDRRAADRLRRKLNT